MLQVVLSTDRISYLELKNKSITSLFCLSKAKWREGFVVSLCFHLLSFPQSGYPHSASFHHIHLFSFPIPRKLYTYLHQIPSLYLRPQTQIFTVSQKNKQSIRHLFPFTLLVFHPCVLKITPFHSASHSHCQTHERGKKRRNKILT